MRTTIRKNKKTKLIIAGVALISFALLTAGGVLLNPICLGAGVAGLFLSGSALVSLYKPAASHPYV